MHLAAYAVRAGDKNRIFVIFLKNFFVVIKSEKSCKAAFKLDDSRVKGAGDLAVDAFDHFVVCTDIDTALAIGNRVSHLSPRDW